MPRPEDLPVILKNRRTVFENSVFRIFSDHIADSKGNEVKDFVVVAPRISTPELITGVAIIPLWNGQVVLLRTFRHPVQREVLEAPRGFVDLGETPEHAALRELKEETGLVCLPERLVPLGFCMPEAGVIAARVALFAALDCREENGSGSDEIGLGKRESFTLQQAERLLKEMVLEDATTSLALHRLFLMQIGGS
jgi:ADP-ribose pyrophosphatase